MMGIEEYISEFEGKFYIDRIFNDKKYNFGIFDNYEDALKKLEYLEEEGWPISKDIVEKNDVTDELGLSLNNIEEIDGNFVIFKFINNQKVIFGEYDSLDEAKYIRNNLIDNAWESTEPYDRSKYGKYILKDNNRFVVKRTYKGSTHFFGYFKTLDEALKCREDLVSTNWGDLNIPIEIKKGKYISYNGIMYTVQRMVDGRINVYGFFNDLESAIEQRDWLVNHGWSRLEVPDDSKRHIHKRQNKYLVYKRSKDDLEYFGTFDSFEEAKRARNKLIENDWVLDDSQEIEKISDHVYFDGEFYIIEKNVNGQRRIYGVYKNKNQAISDKQTLIKYDWDGVYALPNDEYPYGENIVPFDYIFILKENDKEIGRYYSFRDAVIARNEIFGKFGEELNKLTFSVKVGKSYKNRGWSIIRDSTYDLIPKLEYEDECDIIVDGIPTTAKLNLLPRIFYNQTEEVVNHLKELAEIDPNDRIDVQLLLNKDCGNGDLERKINSLNDEIRELNAENSSLKKDIVELKDILNYIDEENFQYSKKFDSLEEVINKFNQINLTNDDILSVYNKDLGIKLRDILNLIEYLNDLYNKKRY